MGKRIIVKGADFSENGFQLPNVLVLTEQNCVNNNCGVMYQTGELSEATFDAWKASDLINIEGLSTLTFTSVYQGTNFGLAFFSTDNVSGYISGIRYTNQIGSTVDIPEGAKYIRFCSYTVYGGVPTILTLQ